jgi:hypothetical protein
MLHMIVLAEIPRRFRVAGGDDVPPRPAARDMVERGEAAGDVEGLVIGGAGGRHQADVLGDAGQGGKQCKRLEGGDGVAALQRLERHVEDRQVVGHEKGVEFAALQSLDQLFDQGKIEIGVRDGAGIAPGAGMDADRAHEGAKPQLPGIRHCWFSYRFRVEMGFRGENTTKTAIFAALR